MALYTGFTICQQENSWIDHRHWQAEGVVLPPCLIIDPASLPDSPFRDFVVIAFIRGWKSQPYSCIGLLICFGPWFLSSPFFFLRGDVGWTIRGWIFPNLSDRHCTDRSIDVLWVGLRSGNCLRIVCPSGNISLYLYIYIYIFISHYIFYPIFYWLHCVYDN